MARAPVRGGAVSDRLRVSYPDMGIDRDFFVEGRSITVSEGWTLVTGSLLLRAAPSE